MKPLLLWYLNQERSNKDRELQTNFSYEYRCKNTQIKFSQFPTIRWFEPCNEDENRNWRASETFLESISFVKKKISEASNRPLPFWFHWIYRAQSWERFKVSLGLSVCHPCACHQNDFNLGYTFHLGLKVWWNNMRTLEEGSLALAPSPACFVRLSNC